MWPQSKGNYEGCNAEYYKSNKQKENSRNDEEAIRDLSNTTSRTGENSQLSTKTQLTIRLGLLSIRNEQAISPQDARYKIAFCWSSSSSVKSILYMFNETNGKIYFFQVNIPGMDVHHGDNVPITLSDGSVIKYRQPVDQGKYRIILSTQVGSKKIKPSTITSFRKLNDDGIILYDQEFIFYVDNNVEPLKRNEKDKQDTSKTIVTNPTPEYVIPEPAIQFSNQNIIPFPNLGSTIPIPQQQSTFPGIGIQQPNNIPQGQFPNTFNQQQPFLDNFNQRQIFPSNSSQQQTFPGNFSPAFRSADGRSEREGMLSSTTNQQQSSPSNFGQQQSFPGNFSPAFRSADGRSEREGVLSSTTNQQLSSPSNFNQQQSFPGNFSPAFRSADVRSEREGVLSSTTNQQQSFPSNFNQQQIFPSNPSQQQTFPGNFSPAFRSADGRSEREGVLSSRTTQQQTMPATFSQEQNFPSNFTQQNFPGNLNQTQTFLGSN